MKTQSFGRSAAALNPYNSLMRSIFYDVSTHARNYYDVCAASPLAYAVSDYRGQRENGDKRDEPKDAFPAAGFEALKIKASTYKPDGPKKGLFGNKEDYWPDKQGRYWWRLTLENGSICEDFYWKKDEARGWPDRADSDRYWFTVHHAPSGTKIEGFSSEPDRVKGHPDKDGKYWSYAKYTECGPIKAWMEEKDKNYVARLQLKAWMEEEDKNYLARLRGEKEQEQSNAAALGPSGDFFTAFAMAERLRIAEMKELEDRKLREESEKRAAEIQRLEEARLAAEKAQKVAAAQKNALEQQERLRAEQEKNAQTKTPSKTLLETVSAKDLTTLKQLADSKETVWADIDAHGNNAFHLAAKSENSKTLKLLLESAPQQSQAILLRQPNEEDETPLHLVARSFKPELVSATLTGLGKNAERTLKAYSERGYLPIHEAAQSGEMKTIQALLNAGADINALTQGGLTVAQCAELNGHSLLAQLLTGLMKPTSSSSSSASSTQHSSTPLLMQALYDYQAQSQQELSVFSGEAVSVLEQTGDGWGYCQNSRGHEGYLPMNFLDLKTNSADAKKYSDRSPESSGSLGSTCSAGSSGSSGSHSHSADKKVGSSGSRGNAFSANAANLKGGIDGSGVGVVDLLIPFSEITLGKELGKGGFGVVYRGERHGEDVAVKQLLCQKMDEATKQDFMNEASIMLRLQHGNIVRLYGVSLEPYAMVMEFLVKGSLYDLLRSNDPLSFGLRYKIALDIANGLSFLHSREMVHCDLKSLNVLLDDRYRAKLADFGMSKVRTSTSSFAGALSGTVHWSSPEVINDEKYGKPADVYSYGVILWEILARKLPYASMAGRGAIMNFVVLGKREPIPENSPEILARLTTECWAQEPEQRPTMAQVVGALKESPVTDEMAAASEQMDKTADGMSTAGYDANSGPGRGRGLPSIPSSGRSTGRDGGAYGRGRGLPQPPPSGPSGGYGAQNAYGLDSSPIRDCGSPKAAGGSGFFQPQPAATGLGGAYGVNSGQFSGRGLPAIPGGGRGAGRAGSGAFAAPQIPMVPAEGNAYALDSSPQPARGRGLAVSRGSSSGRGFFAPVQHELIALQGEADAYSLDSAKPSAVRDRGASLQNSGYGQGGYG